MIFLLDCKYKLYLIVIIKESEYILYLIVIIIRK